MTPGRVELEWHASIVSAELPPGHCLGEPTPPSGARSPARSRGCTCASSGTETRVRPSLPGCVRQPSRRARILTASGERPKRAPACCHVSHLGTRSAAPCSGDLRPHVQANIRHSAMSCVRVPRAATWPDRAASTPYGVLFGDRIPSFRRLTMQRGRRLVGVRCPLEFASVMRRAGSRGEPGSRRRLLGPVIKTPSPRPEQYQHQGNDNESKAEVR